MEGIVQPPKCMTAWPVKACPLHGRGHSGTWPWLLGYNSAWQRSTLNTKRWPVINAQGNLHCKNRSKIPLRMLALHTGSYNKYNPWAAATRSCASLHYRPVSLWMLVTVTRYRSLYAPYSAYIHNSKRRAGKICASIVEGIQTPYQLDHSGAYHQDVKDRMGAP